MKLRFPLVLIAASLFCGTLYGQDDVTTLHSVVRITDPQQKINGLRSFLSAYPTSYLQPRAFYYLFDSYLGMQKNDSALAVATRCIAVSPEQSRGQIQMMLAEDLVDASIGLDSAEVYINAAEQWARVRKRPELGEILNTKAKILSQKGNSLRAEELEYEALMNDPANPEFLRTLGMYKAKNGKSDQALRALCQSMLFGYRDETLKAFESISRTGQSDSAADHLKETIVNEVVRSYIDTTKPERIITARSTAAALMARTGINLKKAREWASSAAKSPEKGESIEEFIELHINLALVSMAEKKYTEAISILGPIADLVDPWNDVFWWTLGQAYERTGKIGEAKNAYLYALVGDKSMKLMNAYMELLPGAEQARLSPDSLTRRIGSANEAIEGKRRELIDYRPGKEERIKTNSSKVVLAELFTGAECGPCQSADRAFDFLEEAFPRSELAIMEYHLHIPQPDPMTNPDSWDRYVFYGGNFGTPTAVIDGTQKIIGGGPFYISENRFNVYNYFIRRALRTPLLAISGSARLAGDVVNLDLQLHVVKKERKGTVSGRLHIALVEKSISYAGSNGITKHRFVVRRLVDGAKGMPVALHDGEEAVTKEINLGGIEQELQSYLDTVARHPSWRPSFAGYPGFKEKPDTLDRSNLAIVAWVQDPESKSILQSFYCDISRSTPAR